MRKSNEFTIIANARSCLTRFILWSKISIPINRKTLSQMQQEYFNMNLKNKVKKIRLIIRSIILPLVVINDIAFSNRLNPGS